MSTQTDQDIATREQKLRTARVSRVNRILEMLQGEFTAEEMRYIAQDLWLVMQIACGPERAAIAIRCSQIN